MGFIKGQAQRCDGAGLHAQQFIQLVRLAEAQAGRSDQLGHHRGLKALVGTDQQQIKNGFLTVAQKQILADHSTKLLFSLCKLLHGAGLGMLHLTVRDIQLFQQGVHALGITTIHWDSSSLRFLPGNFTSVTKMALTISAPPKNRRTEGWS